jgi:hypothetical protein
VHWNGVATEVPYNVMDKVGDIYKKTFRNVQPCDIIEFKIVEYDYGNGTNWIGDISDRCFNFTVLEQCNVTITYNPETEVVDFYGDHIQLITSPFLSKVTVVGNGNGTWLNGVEWKPEDNSNIMTELEDKLYQITYKDVEAGDNYQFKFTADGSFADNWSGTFEGFGTETNAVYNFFDNILFSLTEKSESDLPKEYNLTEINSAIWEIKPAHLEHELNLIHSKKLNIVTNYSDVKYKYIPCNSVYAGQYQPNTYIKDSELLVLSPSVELPPIEPPIEPPIDPPIEPPIEGNGNTSLLGVAVSPTTNPSKYSNIAKYLLYMLLCASSTIIKSKCPGVNNLFPSFAFISSIAFIIV